jgi:hypothetical protein
LSGDLPLLVSKAEGRTPEKLSGVGGEAHAAADIRNEGRPTILAYPFDFTGPLSHLP